MATKPSRTKPGPCASILANHPNFNLIPLGADKCDISFSKKAVSCLGSGSGVFLWYNLFMRKHLLKMFLLGKGRTPFEIECPINWSRWIYEIQRLSTYSRITDKNLHRQMRRREFFLALYSFQKWQLAMPFIQSIRLNKYRKVRMET